MPPNRAELRPKLRPGKITGYVIHDFEAAPQASSVPSGASHSSFDKPRRATHWRRRLCFAGIYAGTGLSGRDVVTYAGVRMLGGTFRRRREARISALAYWRSTVLRGSSVRCVGMSTPTRSFR